MCAGKLKMHAIQMNGCMNVSSARWYWSLVTLCLLCFAFWCHLQCICLPFVICIHLFCFSVQNGARTEQKTKISKFITIVLQSSLNLDQKLDLIWQPYPVSHSYILIWMLIYWQNTLYVLKWLVPPENCAKKLEKMRRIYGKIVLNIDG